MFDSHSGESIKAIVITFRKIVTLSFFLLLFSITDCLFTPRNGHLLHRQRRNIEDESKYSDSINPNVRETSPREFAINSPLSMLDRQKWKKLLSNSTYTDLMNLNETTISTLVNDAITHTLQSYEKLTEAENEIMRTGRGLSSREDDFNLRYFSSSEYYQREGRKTLAMLSGTRYLTIQTKPSFEDIVDFQIAGILQIDLRSSFLYGYCQAKVECENIKIISGVEYRNNDGSCNNRARPHWGMAGKAYYREIISQPYYDDVINAPRSISVDKLHKLPSARDVSAKVSPPMEDLFRDNDFSVLMMQFGQFISHDFTQIVVPLAIQEQAPGKHHHDKQSPGMGFDCCKLVDQESSLVHSYLRSFESHPECFPIHVSPDDPYYSKFGVKCLNFIRAMPVQPDGCNFPVSREQMNAQTAYLDLSQIYGNQDDTVASIRAFEGGRLKVQALDNSGRHHYPPKNKNYSECSIPESSPDSCYKTGDDRGNMHLWLVALQIIFLRAHNGIARNLEKINPHWSDEKLFLESRRILVAVYQHITYQSHLPLILGPEVMRQYHLSPLSTGYSHHYSQAVEGSASITVSVAAYRLHNLIPSKIHLEREHGSRENSSSSSKSYPLSSTYFDPSILNKDASNFDQLIEGMTSHSMSKFDQFVTSEVTDKLFHAHHKKYGHDLGAIDIQRGRDVGLSGYNSWVQFCGDEKFHNIDDLSRSFSPNFVQSMKSLYTNIDDVDFWPAGIAEAPVAGGVIGKTFACVAGMHFARLKFGDRFWYENSNTGVAFTRSKYRLFVLQVNLLHHELTNNRLYESPEKLLDELVSLPQTYSY